MQRLESDFKKLKADLQSSRAGKSELRKQVALLMKVNHRYKEKLMFCKRDCKVSKSRNKQTIRNLERKITEEKG